MNHTAKTDQIGQMPWLICVFAGCASLSAVFFFMLWLLFMSTHLEKYYKSFHYHFTLCQWPHFSSLILAIRKISNLFDSCYHHNIQPPSVSNFGFSILCIKHCHLWIIKGKRNNSTNVASTRIILFGKLKILKCTSPYVILLMHEYVWEKWM